jgi:hypothetical protein
MNSSSRALSPSWSRRGFLLRRVGSMSDIVQGRSVTMKCNQSAQARPVIRTLLFDVKVVCGGKSEAV